MWQNNVGIIEFQDRWKEKDLGDKLGWKEERVQDAGYKRKPIWNYSSDPENPDPDPER